MKILIVSRTESGGGTEKHVREISNALRARSWDIHNHFIDNGGFWRLYHRIYSGRYDVVHFFLPRPYVLGSIACELALHRNRIMSRRSLRGCYQTPLIRWIEERLHRRTKILVANSPAVFVELAAEAPKDAEMRLIRNGVAYKPPYRLKTHCFTMLCVANDFPYKGIKDLIAAISIVGPKLPEPWQLILVGRGTVKYSKHWRIQGLGYRNNIDHQLGIADLFILPSHEEGSSNALLEAMAAGIPVIATDVGGNRDAIIPGQTGMLVPPGDPESLGLAIGAMAWLPSKRAEFGAAGQDYIAKKFSFNRCVDEYESLYRSAA